jgi:hypothetical protein
MASRKGKTGKPAKPKAPAKPRAAARPKAKAKAAVKPKAVAKTKVKAKPKAKARPKSAAKPKAVAKTKKRAAKPKAPDNRRRFDRRNTQIAAELEHDGGSVKGTVTNLSLAGCLFAPTVRVAVGTRIKLKLSGDTPVAATVKAVSDQGVHCMLHAGGVTLGRLSVDLDDMALLMLNAGRPHDIAPPVATPKPRKTAR